MTTHDALHEQYAEGGCATSALARLRGHRRAEMSFVTPYSAREALRSLSSERYGVALRTEGYSVSQSLAAALQVAAVEVARELVSLRDFLG